MTNKEEHIDLSLLRYWSPELELGLKLIDDQHKAFLYRFQKLEDVIIDNSKEAQIDNLVGILRFLHRYVLTHFRDEEQEILAYNFPEYGEHAQQHDKYKENVFRFEEFVRKNIKDLTKCLNIARSMLYNWFKEHISGYDKRFVDYVRDKEKSERKIEDKYHWMPQKSQIWTPELSVDNDVLDQQHQELIKRTEFLINSQAVSQKEVRKISDFLPSYILDHFTDEEQYMIDINFPDLYQHTFLHADFRRRFIKIKRDFEEHLDYQQLQAHLVLFMESLIDQIREKDMLYKRFYKAQKSRYALS